MSNRILLVEDDRDFREVVTDYLIACGWQVWAAVDGEKGLYLAQSEQFDLLLLDVMLPEMDGFTLLRELRQTQDTPAIFLTARISEPDRLRGYLLGCDDYICKPCSLAELNAKATAVVRRSKGLIHGVLSAGEIALFPDRGIVTVEGEIVPLSGKEYALLQVLLERKGQLLSRETLLRLVWGSDYEGSDRVVDNRIKNLRRQLGSSGKQIRTVFGGGYRLEADDA